MPSKTVKIGPTGEVSQGHGQSLLHPGRKRGALTIFNTGPDIAYLETDNQNTSPTSGQPLSVGGVQPWDADLPLFAACPTVTTLVISDNSQPPFDPAAIAAQIIAQGLAQDIADAISITGAPPVDAYAHLSNVTFNAGVVGSHPTAVLDVTTYNSVSVAIDNGLSTISIQAVWLDQLGNIIGVDTAVTCNGQPLTSIGGAPGTIQTRVDFPIRGPQLIMNYEVLIPSAGAVGGDVFGSYKTLERIWYQSPGSGTATGTATVEGMANGGGGGVSGNFYVPFCGVQCISGNNAAGATVLWQPDITAGPANLIFRFTAATNVTILVRTPTAIYPLATHRAETALPVAINGMLSYSLNLGAMPLEISMQTSAASGYRITLDNNNAYSS